MGQRIFYACGDLLMPWIASNSDLKKKKIAYFSKLGAWHLHSFQDLSFCRLEQLRIELDFASSVAWLRQSGIFLWPLLPSADSPIGWRFQPMAHVAHCIITRLGSALIATRTLSLLTQTPVGWSLFNRWVTPSVVSSYEKIWSKQ